MNSGFTRKLPFENHEQASLWMECSWYTATFALSHIPVVARVVCMYTPFNVEAIAGNADGSHAVLDRRQCIGLNQCTIKSILPQFAILSLLHVGHAAASKYYSVEWRFLRSRRSPWMWLQPVFLKSTHLSKSIYQPIPLHGETLSRYKCIDVTCTWKILLRRLKPCFLQSRDGSRR